MPPSFVPTDQTVDSRPEIPLRDFVGHTSRQPEHEAVHEGEEAGRVTANEDHHVDWLAELPEFDEDTSRETAKSMASNKWYGGKDRDYFSLYVVTVPAAGQIQPQSIYHGVSMSAVEGPRAPASVSASASSAPASAAPTAGIGRTTDTATATDSGLWRSQTHLWRQPRLTYTGCVLDGDPIVARTKVYLQATELQGQLDRTLPLECYVAQSLQATMTIAMNRYKDEAAPDKFRLVVPRNKVAPQSTYDCAIAHTWASVVQFDPGTDLTNPQVPRLGSRPTHGRLRERDKASSNTASKPSPEEAAAEERKRFILPVVQRAEVTFGTLDQFGIDKHRADTIKQMLASEISSIPLRSTPEA